METNITVAEISRSDHIRCLFSTFHTFPPSHPRVRWAISADQRSVSEAIISHNRYID